MSAFWGKSQHEMIPWTNRKYKDLYNFLLPRQTVAVRGNENAGFFVRGDCRGGHERTGRDEYPPAGIGLWEANAFVQGTAFVLSLAVMWIFGKGHLRSLTEAPWWNLLGGALGLVITVTVMLSIKGLNPTIAISTILIAQLLVAAAIDYFGWMGQEKMNFAWRQWAGVGLMLAGVVLTKWTK